MDAAAVSPESLVAAGVFARVLVAVVAAATVLPGLTLRGLFAVALGLASGGFACRIAPACSVKSLRATAGRLPSAGEPIALALVDRGA